MVIGFTGTRSGMSDVQKTEVEKLLNELHAEHEITGVIHGGCVGADIDFHNLCLEYPISVYLGHFAKDPFNHSFRGDCKGADHIRPSKTHFERNRDIVNHCDILIACPYTDKPTKGGTWYTINYAKKVNKPLKIINRYE